MAPLVNPKPSSNLTELVQDLNRNLTALQPKTETAQIITYALLATVVVGIMVYQYIKIQELND